MEKSFTKKILILLIFAFSCHQEKSKNNANLGTKPCDEEKPQVVLQLQGDKKAGCSLDQTTAPSDLDHRKIP